MVHFAYPDSFSASHQCLARPSLIFALSMSQSHLAHAGVVFCGLAASTDPDTFPLQMASCNQERPHCTASQYRRTGNTERFNVIAAPNWFASPAHSVNGRGHSGSVEFGLSVFHTCPSACRVAVSHRPHAVVFCGATLPPRKLAHVRCRLPPVVSGIPHCTSASMAIRGVSCAGLGPEQSSSGLPLSRDCALFVARGPVRHAFPFNLLNSG